MCIVYKRKCVYSLLDHNWSKVCEYPQSFFSDFSQMISGDDLPKSFDTIFCSGLLQTNLLTTSEPVSSDPWPSGSRSRSMKLILMDPMDLDTYRVAKSLDKTPKSWLAYLWIGLVEKFFLVFWSSTIFFIMKHLSNYIELQHPFIIKLLKCKFDWLQIIVYLSTTTIE